MAQIISIVEFRKLLKSHGYSCRLRKVSFVALGYGEGHFLAIFRDGQKVIGGVGGKAYWDTFDQQHPNVRQWWQELQVTDGDQKIIFDK